MFIPLALPTLIGFAQPLPVHVSTCDISTPSFIPSGAATGTTMVGDYSLHVRFDDIAPQAIAQVTFALNDGTRVVDAGTFSRNITIDHVLALAPTPAQSCTVSSVRFADGTTWNTTAFQSI